MPKNNESILDSWDIQELVEESLNEICHKFGFYNWNDVIKNQKLSESFLIEHMNSIITNDAVGSVIKRYPEYIKFKMLVL